MPTEAGPRSSTHCELTVRPIRALPLAIDGDLLDEFRQQVERAFGITDTEPPRRLTSAYAVDLVWRDLPLRSARHWRRGQDGSVGYVTTIETMAAPGQCSLWDVAYDALLFCQLVRELPLDRDVTFTLDFQPGASLWTVGVRCSTWHRFALSHSPCTSNNSPWASSVGAWRQWVRVSAVCPETGPASTAKPGRRGRRAAAERVEWSTLERTCREER